MLKARFVERIWVSSSLIPWNRSTRLSLKRIIVYAYSRILSYAFGQLPRVWVYRRVRSLGVHAVVMRFENLSLNETQIDALVVSKANPLLASLAA